jgi:hypothetical protein
MQRCSHPLVSHSQIGTKDNTFYLGAKSTYQNWAMARLNRGCRALQRNQAMDLFVMLIEIEFVTEITIRDVFHHRSQVVQIIIAQKQPKATDVFQRGLP